jgi:hypothetical protein
MVDSERAVQRKRKEQLLRLEEWSRILDEVYPGGFVDAKIEENLTGKAPQIPTKEFAKGASSLEQ